MSEKQVDNKEFETYVYIVETGEILIHTDYTESSTVSFIEKHPEMYTPENIAKKGKYLGRGYVYTHDYLGNLRGGLELCDFWKK